MLQSAFFEDAVFLHFNHVYRTRNQGRRSSEFTLEVVPKDEGQGCSGDAPPGAKVRRKVVPKNEGLRPAKSRDIILTVINGGIIETSYSRR